MIQITFEASKAEKFVIHTVYIPGFCAWKLKIYLMGSFQYILIHSADPQSRLFIVFAHVVRPGPLFKI